MVELRRLADSLEIDIQDLEVSFERISQNAGNGGATVEQWARIVRAGLIFDRLKEQRLLLLREISRIQLILHRQT